MHKEVPVFKTTQELKDFILWAYEAKIKAFKVGDAEVRFSDLAFIADINAIDQKSPATSQSEERNTSKTITDTLELTKEEEDDLLFWSSKS